ncbi:urease accessory protein UreD [Candidatus Nitrosacidococcus sp. I8]|uniref:urease accessory protein UreD n=1 Tax=Candidatus Nitrosacidococcus sp. I8 TaxID=2942908 RepID=UPI0024C5B57A|nr:urease accessory protein UreD [Candidatus Nitrosacidococcus sp. I8]CAH9017663.1 Urease accessory protein UreD [Candidatus Nitrosacidococcus sp. I8]
MNRQIKNTTPYPFSWSAQIELGYQWINNRTVPTLRRHHGPLRVQKHLYPEGPEVCQHILLHPPGGIAGGDALNMHISAGRNTSVQITNPGATRWYHSSHPSYQNTKLYIEDNATLEWLPQESIFFSGCRAYLDTIVELGINSKFITWDIFALGRPGSNEFFTQGEIRQRFQIRFQQQLLWSERMKFLGNSLLLHSPVGLAGNPIAGTLLATGTVSAKILEVCRNLPIEGYGGITQLPIGLVVARFLGQETESARHWFIALWEILRPELIGRSVCFPRIWNT